MALTRLKITKRRERVQTRKLCYLNQFLKASISAQFLKPAVKRLVKAPMALVNQQISARKEASELN
jgi:hypothetical protein